MRNCLTWRRSSSTPPLLTTSALDDLNRGVAAQDLYAQAVDQREAYRNWKAGAEYKPVCECRPLMTGEIQILNSWYRMSARYIRAHLQMKKTYQRRHAVLSVLLSGSALACSTIISSKVIAASFAVAAAIVACVANAVANFAQLPRLAFMHQEAVTKWHGIWEEIQSLFVWDQVPDAGAKLAEVGRRFGEAMTSNPQLPLYVESAHVEGEVQELYPSDCKCPRKDVPSKDSIPSKADFSSLLQMQLLVECIRSKATRRSVLYQYSDFMLGILNAVLLVLSALGSVALAIDVAHPWIGVAVKCVSAGVSVLAAFQNTLQPSQRAQKYASVAKQAAVLCMTSQQLLLACPHENAAAMKVSLQKDMTVLIGTMRAEGVQHPDPDNVVGQDPGSDIASSMTHEISRRSVGAASSRSGQ
ncbi:podJ [Symbiodinium sp. KB8]|nr:podJ [Symbiodinium sp. KB8]